MCNKNNLFSTAMLMLVMVMSSVGLIACSGNDEPAYDVENPDYGRWECTDASSINIDFYDGLELYEGYWAERFRQEWIGKTITINKNTDRDGSTYWLERHVKGNSKSRDIRIEITDVSETSMVCNYYMQSYYDNGHWSGREAAVLKFKRKK